MDLIDGITNKHYETLLVTVCSLQWWIKHEEPVVSSETSQSAGVRAILSGVTNCPCDHDPRGVFYAPVNPNPVRLWTLIPCPSKPKHKLKCQRWTEIYPGRRCPTSTRTSYPLHWCPIALRWNRFKYLNSSKLCQSMHIKRKRRPRQAIRFMLRTVVSSPCQAKLTDLALWY